MSNLPVLFSQEKMPVTAAFKSELMRGGFQVEYDQKLIPVDSLNAIIAEADQYLKPAAKETVLNWAEMLVGSYPSNQVKEPKIYIRSLIFDMQDFPEDIIEIAVHKIRRECKWIPSCAEVYQKCNEMFVARSAVKSRALNQLKEWDRREK